jgi:PAS domain S-box-containing protein
MAIRILNLEDDASDAELVLRELRKTALDFTMRRVTGRQDFELVLRDAPPDLIISDHNLPQFDGRAALDIARRFLPDVPFILFTGSLNEEAAIGYMKAGAADYILKDRVARLGPAVIEALERARERMALRQNQELLRQLIDANPSLIFVKDADGRFLVVNRAAAELYGTTPDALVGKTDADLPHSPEEVARFRVADVEVVTSGRPILIPEQAVTSPVTSKTRWLQIMKVPLDLPANPSPRVLVVATDITERRQLEDQLRQAQKMEAVGQLAGGIAHDFNNLLTAIIGNAELLQHDLPAGSNSFNDLTEIRQAADRAAALTRQLLAFSRKQILQPRILDLNQLITGVERMLRRLLAENIETRLQLASNLGLVHADPGQIEQVLLNLVVNARDAMLDGGTLVIETAEVELDRTYAAGHVGVTPGRYVMLAVTDTGMGMDEETQAHLFEPFFTTKGPGKGTGLGLSTVHGIVQQSGGHIWVSSEVGRGTTFQVYLPVAEPGLGPAPEPVPESPPPGGTETILLVEDAHAVRALASRVLAAAGYSVLEAGDGAAAEVLAARHDGPIHLLLTDVVMPGLSGSHLAQRIAALRPAIRVLYMSGYTDDAIVHMDVLAKGIAFLEKPFAPEVLARRVREVLDAGGTPG